LIAALAVVSPVVEPVELGRVFVGTDGLEGLYGGPEEIVEAIKRGTRKWERGTGERSSSPCSAFRVPRFAFRVGWGRGKFVSWVAATRAKPGAAVIVPVGGEAKFLASQPLAVLPLDPDTHRRLQQLGVKTLGALVALPEEAVVSQFGGPGARRARARRLLARHRDPQRPIRDAGAHRGTAQDAARAVAARRCGRAARRRVYR